MQIRDMPKELVLFYVIFRNVQLYIQLDQFIFFQVILPTLYHQMSKLFMLVLKKVTYEPLEHCEFVDPNVVLGDHHNRLKTIITIFKKKFSRSTLTETKILLSQLSVGLKKIISLNLFISILVMYLSLD